MRRAVLVLGVLCVLVGIAVADPGSSVAGNGGAGNGGVGNRSLSATAVTAMGAESSAWFCTGGTGSGGVAQGALLFSNPTPQAVTGTLTTLATGSAPTSTFVAAPAASQSGLVPAQGLVGGAVASTVVLNEGGVGVSQVSSGALGLSAGPCASTTAKHWYFADASTAQGDTLSLSLFNPTDTFAVVDVSFVSSHGVLAPPAYQGIEVPGDSMAVENVGIHVPNNPGIATVVSTLSGAVVASELESAGQAGNGGASIVLGATTPTSTWSFAQNTDAPTGQTVFHVFNPNRRPVRVTVKIGLEQGAAEPLVMRIPPSSVASLDAQSVTRIPSGSTFAVTFISGPGAGIVVDRHVSSPAGAVAPQQGDTMGVPGGSDRWLLPAAYAPAMSVSTLAVVNLHRTPVTVRLLRPSAGRLETVAGFGRRRVRPGVPLIVTAGTGSSIGAVPLELESSGPVAVEIDALPAGSPGVTVIPALPLR